MGEKDKVAIDPLKGLIASSQNNPEIFSFLVFMGCFLGFRFHGRMNKLNLLRVI